MSMSAIRPQGSSQQAPSQVAGRGREGGCLPEETIKLGLQFHSLWLWILQGCLPEDRELTQVGTGGSPLRGTEGDSRLPPAGGGPAELQGPGSVCCCQIS